MRAQLIANLHVVVNFAVENDDDPTIIREHGLVPFGSQVKDCEASESEAYRSVRPDPIVIGASMADYFGHPREGALIGGCTIDSKYSYDSAHQVNAPRPVCYEIPFVSTMQESVLNLS